MRILSDVCVCVCVYMQTSPSGLNYLLMDKPAAVSEDVLMGNHWCTPPACRQQSCPTSHSPLTCTFFCAPWCAAVGQAGKDGDQRERKGERERHTGWKGRLLLSPLFQAHWFPPIADYSNVLSFQHTWALPHPFVSTATLLFLLLKSRSCKSFLTPTQLLRSPFATLLFLPSLSMGSHCVWRVGERGREVEREK